MPELPEVETIKRDLNKVLIGKKLILTKIKILLFQKEKLNIYHIY